MTRPRQAPIVEELEPRILYSADLMPLSTPGAVESASTLAAGTEQLGVRHELVFVDAGVDDADTLIGALFDDTEGDAGVLREVIRIGADEDGIAVISQALEGRTDVAAVHILSHGSAGRVELGATALSGETLFARAAQIASWGDALSADADVLLYGCDVAASADGRALVGGLAQLTGADVAASDDLTGAAALGGDWELEFSTGAIESSRAIGTVAQQAWADVLAISVGSSSSGQSTTTSVSFSHTVAAGQDGVLIVNIAYKSKNASVTSVTYDGSALTLLGNSTFSGGDSTRAELWILKLPSAGTANVVINMSAASEFVAGATNFFGVDQTTPTGSVSGTAASTATPSVVVTSAAGELVVDTVAKRADSGGTVGANQTQLFQRSTGGGGSNQQGASSWEAGAASVTMSWSMSGSGESAIAAVALKPAVSGETTLTKRVSAASDDAEEEGSDGTTPNRMWLNSSDIELVSDFESPSAGTQKIGLRFTGMNIPVGATITNAYLVFRAVGADSPMTNSDATSLTLKGQLIGNAPTFTSTSGNISSRALTTASTAWTPSTWSSGSDYNSPDISAVVQEIVNQGAWASGNSLAIIITGTGHRASQAYDTDPSTAAQLVVTYTVSAAPTVANLAGDTLRYTAGGGAVVIDQSANAVVTDTDSSDFAAGTLTVSFAAGSDSAEDVLAIRNQGTGAGQIGVSGSNVSYGGSVIGSFTGGSAGTPLVVTLNANANPTSATALMRNITYHDTDTASPTLGTRTVRFVLTDGDGGSSANVDTSVSLGPVSPPAALWVSTTGNATSSVGSGNLSWTDGVAVNFGNPNLALGSGTTAGTFSTVFDIDAFAGGDANISGLHYVSRAVTVGTVNPVSLQAGDVLLSVDANATLGGAAVTTKDIVLFRPTTPGNYSSGTFSVLISNPGNTGAKVRDFALVEAPVTVGGTNLQAGDFLVVLSGGAYDKDVSLFRPTTMATNPTGGTLTELIDGASAGINFGSAQLYGIEIVTQTTVIGGQTLNQGQLLATLANTATVGTNALSVAKSDVFVLTVSATGAGTSSATASMLVRGADVDLASNTETFDALALVGVNQAPVLSGANNLGTILEDPVSNPGTLVSALISGKVTDADAGALTGIAVTGVVNTNGSWQWSANGGLTWNAFGSPSAVASRLLTADSNTYVRFVPNANWNGTVTNGLSFRAWDQTTGTAGLTADTTSNGGSTAFSSATASSSITVTAVSDAPVNTVPGAQSTNEDTARVFSSANGNQISIADLDAAGANNQVTLSVTNGSLTLAGTTGLSFTAGDGTADATMTFRGTAAAINTALNGLSYSPTANYNGGATLTLVTKDSVLLSLEIDTGLLGRYDFENPAALGTDSSPAAGYGATVSGASSAVDGTRGKVLSLDSASDVQSTGHYGNPANVTLAAWVKLGSADSNGSEVISLGDSVALRLDDALDGDKKLLGFFYDGSGWVQTRHAVTLAASGWHHVAYSFNDAGDVATLYLDGAAVASTSTTASISYTQGANSVIGGHGSGGVGYDFIGMIDDVRIYNRALTAGEVAALAQDLSLIDTDTVAITVTAVNDSPTVSSGFVPAIAEDTTAPPGRTIGDLFAGSFNDVDTGSSLSGVLITNNPLNTAQGVWQYSTNSGGNWYDVGSIAYPASLALDVSALVRFVPTADYSGSPSGLSVRALDNTYAGGFTNGASKVTHDASSPGGSSSISSSLVSVTTSVTAVNDAPVVGNQALYFDGNDIVHVAGLGSLTMSSTVTMEAWVRQQAGATTEQLILNKEGEYELGVSATGEVQWAVASTTPGWDWIKTGYFLPADKWTHLAVTYDNGVGTTYVNGTQVHVSAGTGGIGDAHSLFNDLKIGGRGNVTTARFQGAIDEVRVWNTARTAGEIAAQYNQTLTGSESGLVGYWRFAETSGTTAVDSSTQGNNGVLGNGVPAETPTRQIHYTLSEDTTLNVPVSGLLAYASDAEGDPLTAILVSGPANAAAFTLNADGSFSYTPTANFAGLDSFVFKVNDGLADSRSATVILTITAENDAPTLGDGTLAAVAEDTVAPAGQTVSTIFGGQFNDVDGDGFAGIAVVGNTANAGTEGVWQYLSNGGTNWYAIGTVADGATALAVSESTLIRFVPVADYNGTPPTLLVRALDDTYAGAFSTTAGGETRVNVDTTSRGGVTAISGGTAATVSTSITPVDDPAVIGGTISYSGNEGDAVGGTMSATDVDGLTDSSYFTVSTPAVSGAAAIDAATGAWTFTPSDANWFGSDSFTVTVTDDLGGTTTQVINITLVNVNDTPTGLPVVTGTTTEDQVLTADTSGIADADGLGAYSYQWQRSTDGGASWSNVGSDAATYTLGDADVGNVVRVTVSYTDGHGTAESLTSAQSAVIGNVNDAPTGLPVVTGTTTEDQVLTADTSGIADADGLGAYSYQWQRSSDGGASWSNVGSDAATYTLGDADVGKVIRVTVSYTDGHGTAESLTSAQTAAIGNVNDAPTGGVTIDNATPSQGDALTAGNTLADADGLGAITYTWKADGVVVGSGATYVLTEAEVGKDRKSVV